jgi:dolichol-phosphate mannosyltransferase
LPTSTPIDDAGKASLARLFVGQLLWTPADAAKSDECSVDIAVIIPVYNGRNTIEELCERLVRSLAALTQQFAIVLVDDRSPDNVWPVIEKLSQRYHRVRGLQLSRNFGQHRALTAGIDHVRARWYAVMDCDLQDAPEDIEKLLAKALEGFDVVVAARDKGGHGLLKRNLSRPFYWTFNRISGLPLDWSVGVFRVFSDKVAAAFREMREEERFIPAAFAWMGFEVAKVPLTTHRRKDGKSSYSLSKLVSLAISIALSHSEVPLRIVAVFGFVMSVISVGIAGTYFVKALINGVPVVGWTSLIVAIFVLGSVQIFMMGVVGIYVGRIFREAKRRPLYFVRAYSGFEPAAATRNIPRPGMDDISR